MSGIKHSVDQEPVLIAKFLFIFLPQITAGKAGLLTWERQSVTGQPGNSGNGFLIPNILIF